MKVFVCPQCQQPVQQLEEHLATQHADTPYFCGPCQKSFTTKGGLHRHLVLHTGERPFECEFCGKGFAQHGNLKRHRLQHGATNPKYTCEHCPITCGGLAKLARHIARCHTARHPCQQCPKTFASEPGLVAHVRRHHANEPQPSPLLLQ